VTNFQAGVNTFEFVVTNIGQDNLNPTGLRVQATVNVVPEPSTLAAAAMGAGVLGLVGVRRRIKTRRATA
jgi:hypothetical protein